MVLLLFFSDSFERDFHRAVYLFVVFGDWLDVAIPPILSSLLSHSFLSESTSRVLIFEACSKSVVSILLKSSSGAAPIISAISWTPGDLVPLSSCCSQEGNGVSKLLSSMHLWVDLVLVRYISIQNKWGSVYRGLEGALS